MKRRRIIVRTHGATGKQEIEQNKNKTQKLPTTVSVADLSKTKMQQYLSTIKKKSDLPFSHLIHSNKVTKFETLNHIITCFLGVNEIKNMKEITSMINDHSFSLPTELPKGKKTLFLDLDDTLIRKTVFPNLNNHGSAKFTFKGATQTIYFNIRPYCFQFLQNISKLYQLYIYTASQSVYAQGIMQFLNKDKKTITGCLSRQNCIKISSEFYVKDLRIIKNRNLTDMLLLDNFTHSFGQTIENGIPILEFIDNQQDTELIHIQAYLQEIVNQPDVRQSNKQKWRLQEIKTFDSIFKKLLPEN